MSDLAAFAPKERFSDPDSLGAIFVTDEGDLDVREAVASDGLLGPAGFIVTDDPAQIAALDRYEPLKRVAVPDLEQAGEQAAALAELEPLTKAELLDLPEAALVYGAKSLNVEPLREAIAAVRANPQE